MKQKEIFILFKTHLDIGFTDYSKNIVEKYINQYIPNAISIGYELKDSQTPFIWTVITTLFYFVAMGFLVEITGGV